MRNISRKHVFIILFRLLIFINSVTGYFISPSEVYNTLSKYTVCNFIECCNNNWNVQNLTKLESEFKQKLYGQHIAQDVIISALKDHLSQSSPQKALTLSFHGGPGIGKNYVTKFIVNNLFSTGFESKFVHLFTGQIHFPLQEKVPKYREFLKKTIQDNVSKCPTQVFIFDEVDKMPAGILNSIKPMIDSIDNIDKIDYRKTIFIFLSNTGSTEIINHMFKLWENGNIRRNLKLHNFEHLIRLGAFNEKGGFQFSDTIESNLIDHYIPFLPLEKKHVVKCIEDEFRIRKVFYPSEDDIQEVLKNVVFDQKHNLYVTTGCKRISQKVGLTVSKKRVRSRTDL